MNKLAVALCCALFLVGCATAPMSTQPQEVVVKLQIEGVDSVAVKEFGTGEISRSMEVQNREGEISSLSFICNNVLHMKLSGGIGAYEWDRIENDFYLLQNRYTDIKRIDFILNSGGGSAFMGLSIADLIERYKRQGYEINIFASGIVASAAVPIFAVGSKRYATPDTFFMVHQASIFKYFQSDSASDIRAQNEMMDLLKERYLNRLATNSNLSKDKWEAMEKKTTWFGAEKAMEWGLVDKIE